MNLSAQQIDYITELVSQYKIELESAMPFIPDDVYTKENYINEICNCEELLEVLEKTKGKL